MKNFLKSNLPSGVQTFLSAIRDLVTIFKWCLLKVCSVFMYRLFGISHETSLSVIKLGNSLFSRNYPDEMYADYESYYSYVTPVDASLSVYGHLGDIDEWIKGKKVLDLGAGLGQYSESILSRGASSVTALEYQKCKADWIQQRVQGVRVVQGSASELPFEDSSFDSIFSHTVFEHLPDVKKALLEAHRVLRPGGQFLLSFNYLAHRGGHHLFPYIHFPWPLNIIPEQYLCRYWSEEVQKAQEHGGMGFYEDGVNISGLSAGEEIHLNRMEYPEFEREVLDAGWRQVARWSSEPWGRFWPWLAVSSPIRHAATGTVYYRLEKPVSN